MILNDPLCIFFVNPASICLVKIGIETAVDIKQESELRIVVFKARDEFCSARTEENIVVIDRHSSNLLLRW